MARMLPSVISPEIKSNAEKRIFKWFENDPETEGWVVLHSLGIANHTTVMYGELDFFVLAPKLGIFALEVKGGRVSCNEGVWSFTNKYGETSTKSRGPFEQANEGMFGIKEAIERKYGKNHKLSKILMGTGVMFPDIEFDVEGTEGEQWQVFDSRDTMSVGAYIKRIAKNTKRKWEELYGFFPNDKLPDANDIKELTNMLRGNFDKVMTMSKRISYVEEELISLTAQQYFCLDQIEDNPRCLIRGGAGTGKTLLAIEEVKRSAAAGERVAFFCFNNMLGNWLKQYFETQPAEIRPTYVGTIHSWMLQTLAQNGIKEFPKSNDDMQRFYQEELPLMVLDSLDDYKLFDKIVIDEAQDIIGTDSFDVLDAVLKRGLERGKWVLFGDFSHQAIYNNIDAGELIEKLESLTSFIRYKLKINCRNTKRIGDEIKSITGFKSEEYIWSKVDGIPVDHKIYSDFEEEKEMLERTLKKLIGDGIPPSNITILSPFKRENSVVAHLKNLTITDYKPNYNDEVQFSTIQAYKGLENVVVILVDIDSFQHEQLMYVGLSRARSSLVILESKKARKEYLEIMRRRLDESGHTAFPNC